MKIGIITWHYFGNFGSALQAYALQNTIQKLGHEVKIINYRNPKYSGNGFKQFLQYCVGRLMFFFHVNSMKYLFPFVRFCREKLNQTKCVRDKKKIKGLLKDIDILVFGSDQIWAPNVFDSVYMGDFGNQADGIKKISYAASIGLNYIPANKKEEYKRLLLDFDDISVREEVAKCLLEDNFSISSEVVLDPTLLLNSSEYRKMERKAFLRERKYIFCYFLNPKHRYQRKIENLIQEKKYDFIGISACVQDCEWMEKLVGIGPCEFLWLIDHAEIVLTDSYHGTIFSLLFHKCFWTFERFALNDPIDQNSRIYQLADMFSITDRIIRQNEMPNAESLYDFDMFERRLEEQRIRSINFLKGALQ